MERQREELMNIFLSEAESQMESFVEDCVKCREEMLPQMKSSIRGMLMYRVWESVLDAEFISSRKCSGNKKRELFDALKNRGYIIRDCHWPFDGFWEYEVHIGKTFFDIHCWKRTSDGLKIHARTPEFDGDGGIHPPNTKAYKIFESAEGLVRMMESFDECNGRVVSMLDEKLKRLEVEIMAKRIAVIARESNKKSEARPEEKD